MAEITRLRCVLFTFQCKSVLLYITGCSSLIILYSVFIRNIQIFVKYYMTNSLNIKPINSFICASVIIYRLEDKCNTYFHPSEWQFSE